MKNNFMLRRLAAASLLSFGIGAAVASAALASPLQHSTRSVMNLAPGGFHGGMSKEFSALFPVGSGDSGAQADLAFQRSSFMRHTAYRHIATLDNDFAPDGAYGRVNRAFDSGASADIFIEEQRPGGDLILGGIANHDTAAIDQGIKILQWGFNHQNSDGSFQTGDAFHSTSFFVEATAHSMLDLQASEYGSQYSGTIRDFTRRLQKAVQWMRRPSVERKGIDHNRPFTHRRYLVACAMGETGVLANDDELIRHSEDYVNDGLSMQTPEGWNPERGGHDDSYNALGLLYAEQYYTIVARPSLRRPLMSMLSKGVAWEETQIQPTGEVSTEGNSRVGAGAAESDRAGVKKHVASSQVIRCLAYYSQLTGDTNALNNATSVAMFYRMYKP